MADMGFIGSIGFMGFIGSIFFPLANDDRRSPPSHSYTTLPASWRLRSSKVEPTSRRSRKSRRTRRGGLTNLDNVIHSPHIEHGFVA
jgi:hypothetical protein